MKKLYFILALLLSPTFAEAATRYVDVNLGSNCVSNYSIASRNCSGSDGAAYTAANINSAVQASTGGDTIRIRAGTYTKEIRDSTYTWPTTSAGARLVIESYPGETVTFVVDGVAALGFGGAFTTVRNITFTSTGAFAEVIGLGGHDNRFENLIATGGFSQTSIAGNVVLINAGAHDNFFTGGEFYDPGKDVQGGFFSGDGYPFYVSGNNNTIEHAYIHNARAYGIHNYHTPASNASGNIYRYNRIEGVCQTLNTCSAILLGSGTDNQAYGNVIESTTGTGVGLLSGIHIGNGSVRSSAYNNTIMGSKFSCLSWDNSTSAAVVKNNLCFSNPRDFYNASADDTSLPPSGSVSNNRCDSVVTGCSTAASPGFVDAANHNFSLMVGSAMINGGVAAIASGITACKNNTNPAIGAVQDLGAPTATVNGTALVITVPNNCAPQMLPATAVTGFTAKKNASGDTITANIRSGSNSYAATLTSAFVGGDTCLFSYSQSGNAVSDNNIGGVATSNQELFAFTDAACTNITAGTGTVGLSHWRVYLLQGATDTTWVAKCAEDSTNCVVAPGSKLWVRFKLRNNSGSNYSPFNFVPRWRYNGGSYVTLTNANYVNAIKVVGTSQQLGTVLSDSTTLTQDQLTSNQTNVACQAIRTTGAFPSLTLNNATETECAQAVDISTAAVAGDTYESCPYDDIGTALTCSTPIKLTIGSFASAR